MELCKQIAHKQPKDIKEILNAAINFVIDSKKLMEFDLDEMNKNVSIELLYEQINLCAIIHSSIDILREELLVVDTELNIDLQKRIIELVRLFYGDGGNRRLLDSVILKLPPQLQEEIFVEYLPNVEFPSHSVLKENDMNFKVSGEEIENLHCFQYLPDNRRNCLLSRLLISRQRMAGAQEIRQRIGRGGSKSAIGAPQTCRQSQQADRQLQRRDFHSRERPRNNR